MSSMSTKTKPGVSGKAVSGLGVAHIVPKAGDEGERKRLTVKVEKVEMTDQQVDRLTSGVTVDVSSATEEVSSSFLPAICMLLTYSV